MALWIPISSIRGRVHLKGGVGERGEAERLENEIHGATCHHYVINT